MVMDYNNFSVVALVLGADVTDLVFNPAEEMSTAYLLIQGAVVLPLGFGLLSSAAVRASMSEVNTSLLCGKFAIIIRMLRNYGVFTASIVYSPRIRFLMDFLSTF